MRPIDAEELLEHLEACLQNGRPLSNLYDLSEIVRYVKSMPTIAASPWHRVEDELPEIGKRVLVSYGGYVQILKRTDSVTYNGRNYWWNEADGLWERVEEGSYWMPIEPPKEE